MLKYEQLKHILPQAQPFLLLDYVESYDAGHTLTAVKNLTVNEWIFQGHRSQSDEHKAQPAQYPSTLLIEAAAQAALVLYHVTLVKPGQARPRYALGRIKADFSRAAETGEQVRLEVRAGKIMRDSGYADVSLEADGEKMGEATVFYTVRR